MEIVAMIMAAAQKARPDAPERAPVEEGHKLVASLKNLERHLNLRGKLKWKGDLEAMRRDNFSR
ncbi:MAG: type II toxin-antitoxin system VapB family antitoxin [Opitutales bacterium]